jgi:hypothetical protein
MQRHLLVGLGHDGGVTGDGGATEASEPEPPRDYLVGSIVAMVMCAPWGLIPLVLSVKARRRWAGGDPAGAAAAAEKAKGWIMTFGLIWIIILLLTLAGALHIGGVSLGGS